MGSKDKPNGRSMWKMKIKDIRCRQVKGQGGFPLQLPPWDVCLFMGQFFLHAVCVAVEWLCRVLCSSFRCAIWRWGWSGPRQADTVMESDSSSSGCPKGDDASYSSFIAHIYRSRAWIWGGQPGVSRRCGCRSAGGSGRSRVDWSQWLIDDSSVGTVVLVGRNYTLPHELIPCQKVWTRLWIEPRRVWIGVPTCQKSVNCHESMAKSSPEVAVLWQAFAVHSASELETVHRTFPKTVEHFLKGPAVLVKVDEGIYLHIVGLGDLSNSRIWMSDLRPALSNGWHWEAICNPPTLNPKVGPDCRGWQVQWKAP